MGRAGIEVYGPNAARGSRVEDLRNRVETLHRRLATARTKCRVWIGEERPFLGLFGHGAWAYSDGGPSGFPEVWAG